MKQSLPAVVLLNDINMDVFLNMPKFPAVDNLEQV